MALGTLQPVCVWRTINQRMQVPRRLRVADSFSPVDEELVTEDVPPSLRMYIPDRISLAGDVLGCFLGWLKVGGALQHSRVIHLPERNLFLRGPRGEGVRVVGSLSMAGALAKEDLKEMAVPTPPSLAFPHLWGAPVSCAGLTAASPLLPLQLTRISSRLRVLEEQCNAWRQKETLVYSVLVSACLINTWLWLRR
uniref:Mitochondrial fission factor n=1 Tax=Strigops habroptila TaxID=2489341 RepID=A0A672TW89_STRHB